MESAFANVGGGGSDRGQWEISEQVGHILSNTVSLFRPYFSWRRSVVTKPNGSKMDQQVRITDEADKCTDCLCDKTSEANPLMHEGVVERHSDDPKMELLVCHEDCPFFKTFLSSGCSYLAVMVESAAAKLSLCLLHSPFVVLASRQSTVEEFVQLLNNVTRSKAVDLLCNFCTLAEYSCHLWAR